MWDWWIWSGVNEAEVGDWWMTSIVRGWIWGGLYGGGQLNVFPWSA